MSKQLKNSHRESSMSQFIMCSCGYGWDSSVSFGTHECRIVGGISYGPIVDSDPAQVYGTTVEVKRANFDKFANLISDQFNHGGAKYKLLGFDDREATDVISSVFGGESQFDWILGTMMKYLFRFKNFQREKDLLKIATYCYILWLKQGNHIKGSHDTDTTK